MDIAFLNNLAKVTITLFIVLDPIGLTPLLFSLPASLGAGSTKKLIYRVVGGATVLLLFFTITGTWVLRFFGVTLNDLRISGGLLLVIIALQMVLHGTQSSSEREQGIREAPLISPLLVGPGAISASVVLAADYGVLITSLGAIIAMLASLALFLASRFMHRLIGDSGTDLISRIVGVMIAAVGISYIRIGITELITRR